MGKKRFTQKLFLGIELPRFAREQILEARRTWRKQVEGDVKWVPPLNFNLVLRYLGEIPVTKSKSLSKHLTSLAKETKAFQISVDGVGSLPTKEAAKLVYLGFDEPKDLRRLRGDIEGSCRKLDIPQDKKPFEPRVTLGRCPEPQNLSNLRIKGKLKGFMVRNFSLIETRQGQNGPSYHQLRKFELLGE